MRFIWPERFGQIAISAPRPRTRPFQGRRPRSRHLRATTPWNGRPPRSCTRPTHRRTCRAGCFDLTSPAAPARAGRCSSCSMARTRRVTGSFEQGGARSRLENPAHECLLKRFENHAHSVALFATTTISFVSLRLSDHAGNGHQRDQAALRNR